MIAKKQTVEFTNPRGLKLSGLKIEPKNPEGHWALYANCFTCTKNFKSSKWLAEYLAENNIGVLLFDPSGLGESEGDFAQSNFSTLREDVLAAAAWMRENNCAPELQVGHSIGGVASLATASQLASVKAVAVLAAPSNLEDIRRRMLRQDPKITTAGSGRIQFGESPYLIDKQMLDDFSRHEVIQFAADLKKPLLILHSPKDEVLLFDHAEALYQAAQHPKSIVELPDFPHLPMEREQLKHIAQLISDWAKPYLCAPSP